MRAVASQIAAYLSQGVPATLRRIEQARAEPFARWAEGLTVSLLTTVHAQFQYLVMNYFRPKEHSRGLPVQLQSLLAARRKLECENLPEALRLLADYPSYCALC